MFGYKWKNEWKEINLSTSVINKTLVLSVI